jgi:SpoVK/Ycf46/Vps4 family AAA+-type ATPase
VQWFSESGKLVTRLFDHISDMASEEHVLVCVLIDEVESIVSARTTSLRLTRVFLNWYHPDLMIV